jgi:hypothetical protein
VAFFKSGEAVRALGIGSFGPVDPDTSSSTWGHITTTPKPGLAHTDVGHEIGRRLAVPVVFDTDVNAAALGEHLWGAGGRRVVPGHATASAVARRSPDHAAERGDETVADLLATTGGRRWRSVARCP